MAEMIIKKHSFDLAKNRLKEFSEMDEEDLYIDSVQTEGGLFGLGDHKVTGYELNKRLSTIQNNFITINTKNNKVVKEFREVYNALEALDKDYISSIVANVKAIEKTSNDVRTQQKTLKSHNKKLSEQQNKLDAHQTEIEETLKNIEKIVAALGNFRDKLESYDHLTDIDTIWTDCRIIQNEVHTMSEKVSENIDAAIQSCQSLANQFEELSEEVQSFQNEIDTLSVASAEYKECINNLSKSLAGVEEYAVNNKKQIANLEIFREKLSALNHLMDVDEIWHQVEEHQLRINKAEQESKAHTDKLNELTLSNDRMCKRIESNENEITSLQDYKNALSNISHLEDVDKIWSDVEANSLQLVENKKRDEELAVTIQKNKEELYEKMEGAIRISNSAVESLTQKVKYAYWIAGASAGLALVELIVLLMQVI